MKHITSSLLLAFLLTFTNIAMAGKATECNINIGVTLPSYYSWAWNIVGNTMTIKTLIPENSDPHSYQPKTSEPAELQDLDALLINRREHAAYIRSILKTVNHNELEVIDTGINRPLPPTSRSALGFRQQYASSSNNSAPYIPVTDAIRQMESIAAQLGELCPDNDSRYQRNAHAYARRLHRMFQGALDKIEAYDTTNARIATVHDNYAQLMRDLGLEEIAVIHSRRGSEPSSGQIRNTIKQMKRVNANILITDVEYEKKHIDTIVRATGCRVYCLPHIPPGTYTADSFEVDIQRRLDTIVKAVMDSSMNSWTDTAKMNYPQQGPPKN